MKRSRKILPDISKIREYKSSYNREFRNIPAVFTAKALGVPMVIFKKQPSKILNDSLYQTIVTSFTKEMIIRADSFTEVHQRK